MQWLQQGQWEELPQQSSVGSLRHAYVFVCRVLYSYTAVSSTSQALSAADIDTGAIQSALGTLGLIRTVVLALAIVAMVVVVLLSVGHMLSKRQSRGGGEHAGGNDSQLGVRGLQGRCPGTPTCSRCVSWRGQV